MSMEDIFKVLVDSRQQGGTSQSGTQDPMTQLIGGLMGGGQSSGSNQPVDQIAGLLGGLLGGAQNSAPSSSTASPTSSGLGDMLGLLEGVIGGQQSTAGVTANDPIMMMLQPFVNQLAKKVNISPAIATIVVSFVVHKMLSHHPSSGRDSNQFNLDDLLSSGSLSADTLKSSGMVKELSKATGLNEQAASQSLDAAFSLLGGTAKKVAAGKK